MVLQIAVLIILMGSLFLKMKKKLQQHGLTMLIAVLLHTISILAVMIPTFISGFAVAGAIDFGNINVLIAFLHATTGIIAELLGIVLIIVWRFQSSLHSCSKKKTTMRFTLVIWLISLVLGIALFFRFYPYLLPF